MEVETLEANIYMKDGKRFLKWYENDKYENVKETTIYVKYPSPLLTFDFQF